MKAELCSFIDVFNKEFENGLRVKRIEIPKIQRDYAQGRTADKDPNGNILRIRNNFLDTLKNAIINPNGPVILDFVYGNIHDGVLVPLDGQQRLTTLFLLHWYAAKKEQLSNDQIPFISADNTGEKTKWFSRFGYETRYSARTFCNELVSFLPSFDQRISEEITNQSWFPLDWLKDPTIYSMLTMIDAIDSKFSSVTNISIWEKLASNAIAFWFLPIDENEMGSPEELYIKMNSRGEPLTEFEQFKAELEHNFREIDEDCAIRITKKIDTLWTDFLWDYFDDQHLIDNEFLSYFRFICDVICYRDGGTTRGRSNNVFDLISIYFSPSNPKVKENIMLMENCFDCWCDLSFMPEAKKPEQFLDSLFSNDYVKGKVKIDRGERNGNSILYECLKTNHEDRKMPLTRFVILYSVVVYLQNHNIIEFNLFTRRLRIICNLVKNSEDEIADSVTHGNRMPMILTQVYDIITKGIIDDKNSSGFNSVQMQEEKQKAEWTTNNPEWEEKLFELEDHKLLYGQIGIVGLDDPNCFERFISLFNCSYDSVDCALLSIGNYTQKERGDRYQIGSSTIDAAWSALFHRSTAFSGFDNTKRILSELLSKASVFNDALLNSISNNYLNTCEKQKTYDWRYYYIKYPEFRNGRYGKIKASDFENKPYEMIILYAQTQLSENAYQPFLKVLEKHNQLSKSDFGCKLYFGEMYLTCLNAKYSMRIIHNEHEYEVASLPINQNENGIDTENRVEVAQELLPLINTDSFDLDSAIIIDSSESHGKAIDDLRFESE